MHYFCTILGDLEGVYWFCSLPVLLDALRGPLVGMWVHLPITILGLRKRWLHPTEAYNLTEHMSDI